MPNKIKDEVLFKDRVLSHLKINSSFTRPITSAKMRGLWDLPDLTLRKAIGLLRDEGEPIGSSSLGFFYATSSHQLQTTIDSLADRMEVMDRRRSKLMIAQEKMREKSDGQRLLFN